MSTQLWEGKGKTTIMRVKYADRDGAVLEYTWTAKLKGLNKAKGIDVAVTFTGVKVANLVGAGPTTGKGVFFTADGEMATIKSSGYGRPKMRKGKSMEIWIFATASQKLSWINDIAAVVSVEGDDQWQEFSIAINEWDSPGT